MTSVGQAAKTYLPQSVAAYLPSASSSSLETDPDLAPPHPPFLPELRTLSTGAQAASLLPPRVDFVATTSTSASLSDADPGHLCTAVHTSSAVPPLSPADTDPNFEQGVPTPPATLAESPAQLSSSSLSLSTQSAQSEGPPVPQNSLVRPSPGMSTSAPTRTPLPALSSPAVFDDAPIAPAPTSIDNHKSAPAPAPVLFFSGITL
ncbi:hypothetical protein FB451DRAFT_1495739 [Mycena latifolia]|nr:hypothetical protein FB451DRAFT_1495739 [Mycena latifolia]